MSPPLRNRELAAFEGQLFFFFFLNPCLTPHMDAVRLISKDQELQRSLAQIKMKREFLFLLLDTHTQPLFLSLPFLTPCNPAGGFLAPSTICW